MNCPCSGVRQLQVAVQRVGLEVPGGQASDYAAWAGQWRDGLEGMASACFSAEVGD